MTTTTLNEQWGTDNSDSLSWVEVVTSPQSGDFFLTRLGPVNPMYISRIDDDIETSEEEYPKSQISVGDDVDTESIISALIETDALDFWGPEDECVYKASDCIPE